MRYAFIKKSQAVHLAAFKISSASLSCLSASLYSSVSFKSSASYLYNYKLDLQSLKTIDVYNLQLS